jgi:hypothetical protein
MSNAIPLEILQAYACEGASDMVNPVLICPVCGRHHAAYPLLKACMQSTEKPAAQVGDIVMIENGYGWFDGDEAWVYGRNGYKFHQKPTLQFWFVVTAITGYAGHRSHRPEGEPDLHRLSYHVQTLAIKNGQSGGMGGWTTMTRHIPFKTATRKPPEAVVEASRGMIGRTFNNLL